MVRFSRLDSSGGYAGSGSGFGLEAEAGAVGGVCGVFGTVGWGGMVEVGLGDVRQKRRAAACESAKMLNSDVGVT